MLKGNPLPWLLEPDPANPGIRYFALTDLLGRPAHDPDVQAARAAIMATGPVPIILNTQEPAGNWVKPGSGYGPKYQGTVWQIILLAEMGADPDDERVRRGCAYLLDHSRASNGAFSAANTPIPSYAVLCLNGNLLFALQRLGWGADPRMQAARDWLARAITGDDNFSYLHSATNGPGFCCAVNEGKPCGWGANKALRGLLAVPPDQRTPAIAHALAVGADFLLSRDPAIADYPYTERVSSTWFKLGFPLSYWSDVLETVSILADLGYGADPRLQNAIEFVLSKQDVKGRWQQENGLNGKMWIDIEQKGHPSKWVTLRALRALRSIRPDAIPIAQS